MKSHRYLEINFDLSGDETVVFVLIATTEDSTKQVVSKHEKTFPSHMSVLDIVRSFNDDDPVTWPTKEP